jgi:hypothetical protein
LLILRKAYILFLVGCTGSVNNQYGPNEGLQMNKLAIAAVVAASALGTTSANAWWDMPFFGDGFGSGDFSMSMHFSGHGNGHGANRYGYGPYGYGYAPQGYGAPFGYGGAPYGYAAPAPVAPQATASK